MYDPSGHSAAVVLGIMWAVTKFAFSVGMLALAVYGAIKAIAAFIKEPSWLNLLFSVVAVVGVGMSLYSVYKSFRAMQAVMKKGSFAKKFVKTQEPPVSKNTAASGQISDVNQPERVFWSGGKEAQQEAYKYAKANHGTILEKTSLGKKTIKATKNMPWSKASSLWDEASRMYAQSAVGNQNVAHVFINVEKFSFKNSAWVRIESKILQSNNIKIIYHLI